MTLPQEGPVALGAVRLPEGRRITAVQSTEPVAWVTSERVSNPGRLWLELSRLAGETGLRPLLIRADYAGMPEIQLSEEDVRVKR